MAQNMMAAAGASGGDSQQAAAMAQMSEQQLADQFDAYIATADEATLVAIYNQYVSTGSYNDNLTDFGVVSRDAPSSINIYVDSFEDKNSINDAIDEYNRTAKEKTRSPTPTTSV